MTNEHLNTQLYWKLQREHTAFKNWLMHQPPSVIIENAYKYAMMEDVLLTFGNNNLSDEQAKSPLKGKQSDLDTFFKAMFNLLSVHCPEC